MPPVPGLRVADEDDVDGHPGPRPYECVTQLDDEPVLQVDPATAAARGRAVLAGLVTK
ncbi:hypothetical protein AB0E82_37610 [Streptomyces anulatus]|uniref:hypothetical protein n=1 Tax=Streptomyces anulatus TaxID=1892 RepID=UPI0033E99A7C